MTTDTQLIGRVERLHMLSLNAKIRQLQYAGYETGKKAQQRHEAYEQEFTEMITELLKRSRGGF